VPFGWVAAATIGSSLIGGIASNSAANTQADAAQNATASQQQMFNQVMGNLQPYQTAGGGALSSLESQLGIGGPAGQNPTSGQALRPGSTLGPNINGTGGVAPATPATGGTTPGSPGWLNHSFGAADLNANLAPNYGFQLGQGLGQIQNEGAAAGGAVGGNTLSGLNSFAQNYASNAYQQAFQNYTTNQQNVYGRLGNLAQLGEQASTGSASGAPMFSSGISQTIQGLGQAQAAGQVGMANAFSGGANNLSGYYMLNNLMNNNNANLNNSLIMQN